MAVAISIIVRVAHILWQLPLLLPSDQPIHQSVLLQGPEHDISLHQHLSQAVAIAHDAQLDALDPELIFPRRAWRPLDELSEPRPVRVEPGEELQGAYRVQLELPGARREQRVDGGVVVFHHLAHQRKAYALCRFAAHDRSMHVENVRRERLEPFHQPPHLLDTEFVWVVIGDLVVVFVADDLEAVVLEGVGQLLLAAADVVDAHVHSAAQRSCVILRIQLPVAVATDPIDHVAQRHRRHALHSPRVAPLRHDVHDDLHLFTLTLGVKRVRELLAIPLGLSPLPHGDDGGSVACLLGVRAGDAQKHANVPPYRR
mmetsp:Transcript_7226/g.11372  ORF Transcript_7226/g.11372 Transcript_7226/m.11372 type:complete len:314 (-) Transcript_7226:1705-2646(-)